MHGVTRWVAIAVALIIRSGQALTISIACIYSFKIQYPHTYIVSYMHADRLNHRYTYVAMYAYIKDSELQLRQRRSSSIL